MGKNKTTFPQERCDYWIYEWLRENAASPQRGLTWVCEADVPPLPVQSFIVLLQLCPQETQQRNYEEKKKYCKKIKNKKKTYPCLFNTRADSEIRRKTNISPEVPEKSTKTAPHI